MFELFLCQTTIPVVCCMVLIIFTVLLCAKYWYIYKTFEFVVTYTYFPWFPMNHLKWKRQFFRNDSIVCKICASKDAWWTRSQFCGEINKNIFSQPFFPYRLIHNIFDISKFLGVEQKRGIEFPEQFANLCGGGGKVYVSKFLSICQPSNRV